MGRIAISILHVSVLTCDKNGQVFFDSQCTMYLDKRFVEMDKSWGSHGLKREQTTTVTEVLLEAAKRQKSPYFGYTWKPLPHLKKDLIQWTIAGWRRRGRHRMSWKLGMDWHCRRQYEQCLWSCHGRCHMAASHNGACDEVCCGRHMFITVRQKKLATDDDMLLINSCVTD